MPMAAALAAQVAPAGRAGQLTVLVAGITGLVLIAAIGRWRGGGPAAQVVVRRGRAVWAAALARSGDCIGRRLRPAAAAAISCMAGLAAALLVTVAVGYLAKLTVVTHLDRPAEHFVVAHRLALVTRVMLSVTQLGSYLVDYSIACTAGVLIGVLTRRWLPLVVLVASIPAEIGLQKLTTAVVHGAKPAADVAIGAPGGFFSGGSARTLLVCGLACYFLGWAGLARPQRALIWTLAAEAAFLEGYSRLYLGRHWAVDILGGWIFAALALTAIVFAAEALRPQPNRTGRAAELPAGPYFDRYADGTMTDSRSSASGSLTPPFSGSGHR